MTTNAVDGSSWPSAQRTEPQRVRALYNFTGQHTDELNFKKGDIITVTQPLEDGWYEGTLRGVTGWFPANYVAEYKTNAGAESTIETQAAAEHRALLITNIIETEAAFVRDLDSFTNSTLQPLWRLFGTDYDLINRHLELILETHRTLLSGLRSESSRQPNKIGKVFLTIFPRLQAVHCNYCALHPRIVRLIMNSGNNSNNNSNSSNKNSNSNNVNNNCSNPANLNSSHTLKLSLGLSAPFKRMEKYESLLEELTRLTAEHHPDRGDCQRSCSLFRELGQQLASLRRQKDVEAEILNANIRNWEGPPISSFGEVRLTCPVAGQWSTGRKDHYLVAFDSTVVLVSLYNPNEFQLDCSFPLDRTTITKVDSRPLALELASSTTNVVLTFHAEEDLEKFRARVDVYSTVQKRGSARSTEGTPGSTARVGLNGTTLADSQSDSSRTADSIGLQMSAWPSQQSAASRVSRPTSPGWSAGSPLPRPMYQGQQRGTSADWSPTQQSTVQLLQRPPSTRMSLMVSKIRGVLPHSRAKAPLQKEPITGLKRGSSARKNKKELPAPILPPEAPFNSANYERDLQILKIVESFANLSKKSTASIPIGSLASAASIVSCGAPLSSLPSVRVSTLTAHSGSPMDVDGLSGHAGLGRPLSISPVSPGGPVGDAAALRNLQNDVAFLKEQMAKLHSDLQEERRQRKALQDQLNLITAVKRI